MSLLAFAWIAVAVVAAVTGLKYLAPRLHTLTDGIPPRPDDKPCPDHGWACYLADYRTHPTPKESQ